MEPSLAHFMLFRGQEKAFFGGYAPSREPEAWFFGSDLTANDLELGAKGQSMRYQLTR
jgi:hypothetical protein